jgi:hypothetical protein
MALGLV